MDFLGSSHGNNQKRLEEFDMTVITTVPNVSYYAQTKSGDKIEVHNPSDYPDPNILESVEDLLYVHKLSQNLILLDKSNYVFPKEEVKKPIY